MTLHAHLQSLASQFVSEILSALQTATLSELQGTGIRVAPPTLPRVHGDRPAPSPATTSTGRLKRRTLEEVQAVVGQLVTLLGKHPAGLRAEQIRTLMSLDVREVPRILKEAVGGKGVKILSGRKRSTLYGLRSAAGKPAGKPAGKLAGKPARKLARKPGVAKKKSAKRVVSKIPVKKASVKKAAKRTTKRPAKKSGPKRTKAAKGKKPTSKKSAPKRSPKRLAKVAAPPPPMSAAIPAAAE
jgi:hypothetical protein